jgi:RNA polymerase sigma factor (TIGR02999 family)
MASYPEGTSTVACPGPSQMSASDPGNPKLPAAPRPADGEPTTSALFALLYQELHALAQGYLRRERPWHTLQATALVHEAYVQLSRGGERPWQERDHFLATAACAIRRVLVNHAEAHRSQKRGGGAPKVSLDDAVELAAPKTTVDVLALDEALARLEQLDARQCRIVELRFFGGLAIDEIARLLGVSARTVDGDWAMAKAWLQAELGPGGPA